MMSPGLTRSLLPLSSEQWRVLKGCRSEHGLVGNSGNSKGVQISADLTPHGGPVIIISTSRTNYDTPLVQLQVFVRQVPVPLTIDDLDVVTAPPQLGPSEPSIDPYRRWIKVLLARGEIRSESSNGGPVGAIGSVRALETTTKLAVRQAVSHRRHRSTGGISIHWRGFRVGFRVRPHGDRRKIVAPRPRVG